jgi:dimethylargininase
MIAITHKPSPNMEACELSFVSREPIHHALALKQHAAYCQILRDCGAEVRTLETNLALPDCVFVEDTAVVLDEIAVLASMGTASRRPEIAGIEPELKKFRTIHPIELPATLEGGDVVCVGRKILVGLSKRTNRAGVEAMRRIVRDYGYEVLGVPLKDCLHLKSACTGLPNGRLLVNPDWLDVRELKGFGVLFIPKSEPFAADVLSIGGMVCMSAAHPRTAGLVRGLGFEVRTVDLSEFAKAEGGVTCMSIVLEAG